MTYRLIEPYEEKLLREVPIKTTFRFTNTAGIPTDIDIEPYFADWMKVSIINSTGNPVDYILNLSTGYMYSMDYHSHKRVLLTTEHIKEDC